MRCVGRAAIQGGNDGKNIKGYSGDLFIDKFVVGALCQPAVALVYGVYRAQFAAIRLYRLVPHDVDTATFRRQKGGLMINIILYIILGLAAGVFGGIFGIGGGLILVPAMTFFFGMTQHQAQGTSLAILVPPIGILAAWRYYQNGHVDLTMAGFICLGFLFGGLFGANLAQTVSDPALKKLFGIFLLLVSINMIFSK